MIGHNVSQSIVTVIHPHNTGNEPKNTHSFTALIIYTLRYQGCTRDELRVHFSREVNERR